MYLADPDNAGVFRVNRVIRVNIVKILNLVNKQLLGF